MLRSTWIFLPQNDTGVSWTSQVSRVSIVVSTVNEISVPQYNGLESPNGGVISIPTNESPYNAFTVIGIIKNNGTETAGPIWVVTTFYNAAGTVVALNFTSMLTDSLAPGENTTFLATPADNTPTLSNEIVNYSTQIDSLPFTSSSTVTTATPTPAPSILGTVLIVGVAATVVVIVVIVALMMLVRKRQKNTQLEPPLPPPPPPT